MKDQIIEILKRKREENPLRSSVSLDEIYKELEEEWDDSPLYLSHLLEMKKQGIVDLHIWGGSLKELEESKYHLLISTQVGMIYAASLLPTEEEEKERKRKEEMEDLLLRLKWLEEGNKKLQEAVDRLALNTASNVGYAIEEIKRAQKWNLISILLVILLLALL